MGAQVKNDGLFVVGQVVSRAANFSRPNDTSTYTAGDVLADSTTATSASVLVFRNVVNKAGASGCIQGGMISITANVAALQPDLQMYLYSVAPVMQADNAAYAATNDQIRTLVAVIAFPVGSMVVTNTGTGASGNIVCNPQGLVIPFTSADANLYGHLVVRNAYVPVASTNFYIRLDVVN